MSRVYVYFNLHKKMYSVKSLERETYGRVIAHMTSLELVNVKCKVNDKGRLRVISEGVKNVHAGIVGEISHDYMKYDLSEYRQITYNPKRDLSFVYCDTGTICDGGDVCILTLDNSHTYPIVYVKNFVRSE